MPRGVEYSYLCSKTALAIGVRALKETQAGSETKRCWPTVCPISPTNDTIVRESKVASVVWPT